MSFPVAGQQENDFVKGMKRMGKDIKNSAAGQEATKLGKDVAEASREGFREVREALRPTTREVREATRAAWKEFLQLKRDTLRELRQENRRLRREVASRKNDS